MSALNSSVNLLRSAVRSQITSKAHVSAKPAKHTITAGEQAIALVSFFAAILGPSGWVLANLESYKTKQ